MTCVEPHAGPLATATQTPIHPRSLANHLCCFQSRDQIRNVFFSDVVKIKIGRAVSGFPAGHKL